MTIQTLPAWPTPPDWADPTRTIGGEPEILGDGRASITPRLYERVLAQVDTPAPQPGAFRVLVERCDAPGDPGPTQVLLTGACKPTPTQLRALAAALIHGAEIMETADPCDTGTCGHDLDGDVARAAGQRGAS